MIETNRSSVNAQESALRIREKSTAAMHCPGMSARQHTIKIAQARGD